jgi:hypothetical protein
MCCYKTVGRHSNYRYTKSNDSYVRWTVKNEKKITVVYFNASGNGGGAVIEALSYQKGGGGFDFSLT